MKNKIVILYKKILIHTKLIEIIKVYTQKQ